MNETMLSELISNLTTLMSEHGDMPVYTSKTSECVDIEWRYWQDWNTLELHVDTTTDGNDCHKVCILHH